VKFAVPVGLSSIRPTQTVRVLRRRRQPTTQKYLNLDQFKRSMLESRVVKEVLMKKGRVSSVTFTYDKQEYTAIITPKRITLSRPSDRATINGNGKKLVAEYNKKTGKSKWYVEHCCGAQGFGVGPDSGNDLCYACDTPGAKMEPSPENIGAVMVHGKYSPELAKLIHPGIIEYCEKMDSQFKHI